MFNPNDHTQTDREFSMVTSHAVGKIEAKKKQKLTAEWTKKSIKINVNKFIAKYDFDVASKICPIKSGLDYNDDYQKIYSQNALMEVL